MKGFALVEGPNVGNWAPHIKLLMEKAEWPTPILYDWRYVCERIFKGEWQLWLLLSELGFPDLMMVTFVNQLPFGKLCFIELMCGEGVFDLFTKNGVFDNWLKFQGIDLVQSVTRPEIVNFLQRAGWKSGTQMMYRWTERVQ